MDNLEEAYCVGNTFYIVLPVPPVLFLRLEVEGAILQRGSTAVERGLK